jgi:hypothetical protein
MSTTKRNKAHEWLTDTEAMEKAMGEAIQDALREHKLLGYPIVVWKDGKVTWIPPEEIELESEKNGPANGAGKSANDPGESAKDAG